MNNNVTLEGGPPVVLRIGGDLDLSNADLIESIGRLGADMASDQCMQVDCSGLTFVDSTALGALVRLRNYALERRTQVRLVDPPARVRRLLEITGAASLFDL